MAESCILYYITDRAAFPGDEAARRRRLLDKIAEAARAGVDYIQLREKDLSARELEDVARKAVCAIREAGKLTTDHPPLATAFLINSRTDVALAVQADGVHLRSDDITPQEVRQIWKCAADACRKVAPFGKLGAGSARQFPEGEPLIGVSCHTPAEVSQAAANAADFAVFAPVFEKKDTPGARATGLAALQQACQARIPVLALGGVTLANARSCLAAGAAGIAAIRLFQENDIQHVVSTLRGTSP